MKGVTVVLRGIFNSFSQWRFVLSERVLKTKTNIGLRGTLAHNFLIINQ